jgi:hypothetical protein
VDLLKKDATILSIHHLFIRVVMTIQALNWEVFEQDDTVGIACSFQTCILVHKTPDTMFTNKAMEDCPDIIAAAGRVFDCFMSIVHHIQAGGYMLSMDRERTCFLHLLADFTKRFDAKRLKTNDGLSGRIQTALRRLYTEQLFIPPTFILAKREFEIQIGRLRERHVMINGQDSLAQLDTEIQEMRTRSRSATIISTAWRNRVTGLHRIKIQNILNPRPIQPSTPIFIHNLVHCFDSQQLSLKQEFNDQLLELRIKAQSLHASCIQPSKPDWTMEFPPSIGSQNLIPAFKQTKDIIEKMTKGQYIGSGIPQESKPIPEDSVWAEMDSDIFKLKASEPKLMDSYFAKEAVKELHCKALELVLKPIKHSEVSIFDLGKTFPQFRNCSILSRNQVDGYSSALVHTQFTPLYLLFVHSSRDTDIFFIPSNNTVYIACFKDKITVPDIRIAITEIKQCALCRKPASSKCSTCWRNNRVCVRYCSKECTIKDRNRHVAMCGRDLSDEWKSVS